MPNDYAPRRGPRYSVASATARGLAAQTGFAILCLALTYLKWGGTRREMLRDAAD